MQSTCAKTRLSVRTTRAPSGFFLAERVFSLKAKTSSSQIFFPPRTLQYIAKMLQEVSEKLGNKIIQADLTLAK